MATWMRWLAACTGVTVMAACGGGGTAATPEAAPGAATLSAQARLGEKIFNDVYLCASGRQACASCHVAAAGHPGGNDLAAQLGGPLLDRQGGRSSPSIHYLATNKALAFDAEGAPRGGFFSDGRATSLQDQARRPFLAANEMANAIVAEFIVRLSRAAYAEEFKAVSPSSRR